MYATTQPYLGLDEDVLDRLEVGAEVEESPHDFAQDEVLSGAAGEAEYSLEMNVENACIALT